MILVAETVISFDVSYSVFCPIMLKVTPVKWDEQEKIVVSVIGHSLVDPVDPTLDEIRQSCQQIQATWTEEERRRRTTGIVDADIFEMLSGVSF